MKKHNFSESMEQKHKIIVFPFWNMETAEKILREEEQNGYRFVKSRFRYLFTFQKSAQRDVHYVLTYTFPKDEWQIIELQSLLKSDLYRGNLLHQGYFDIFRITKDNVDLQNVYLNRLRYVRRALIQKTACVLLIMLPSAFPMLAGGVAPKLRVCVSIVFAGGLLMLLSCIIGFFVTACKMKQLRGGTTEL